MQQKNPVSELEIPGQTRRKGCGPAVQVAVVQCLRLPARIVEKYEGDIVGFLARTYTEKFVPIAERKLGGIR
ncbi:Uncharacterised protein [Mycobacteroides abscessus subsp. abscessus]|nr:Uncharacterised protein [Mycobacteroides abscessus subsp. abscessus]